MVPTVGGIVHYRIGGTDDAPELRPAMVVKVWGPDCVQLQVFVDGTNDARHGFSVEEQARGLAWRTSVMQGDGVSDWRWPART